MVTWLPTVDLATTSRLPTVHPAQRMAMAVRSTHQLLESIPTRDKRPPVQLRLVFVTSKNTLFHQEHLATRTLHHMVMVVMTLITSHPTLTLATHLARACHLFQEEMATVLQIAVRMVEQIAATATPDGVLANVYSQMAPRRSHRLRTQNESPR